MPSVAIHPEPHLDPTHGSSWPAQGQWTWDDYLRLPDDGQRYEIIEGTLYVSPAPSFDHQFSVTELLAELRNFVKARHLGLVLVAPFDVRLPGVADPVQPDLVFFRTGNEPRAGDKNFHGAPDLIVEVISPSSVRLDKQVKLAAYEKAGVQEYWLADTRSRSITVYSYDPSQACYVELGRFGVAEALRSALLPGFEAPVEDLFPRN